MRGVPQKSVLRMVWTLCSSEKVISPMSRVKYKPMEGRNWIKNRNRNSVWAIWEGSSMVELA